jgi:hypothetical protein
LPKATSRPNQTFTVCSRATTDFANNQLGREPGDFHRFPFIGGKYSVTHVPTMTTQAFGRVCVADLPFRCQAGRSTDQWS